MPSPNLSGMTVEGLMELRERIDRRLGEQRTEIQKQLDD
jgi:hypothetical protein